MIIQFPPGSDPVLIEKRLKFFSFPEELSTLFDGDVYAFFLQILTNSFPPEAWAHQELKQFDQFRNMHDKGVYSVGYLDEYDTGKVIYSPEILTEEDLIDFFRKIGVEASFNTLKSPSLIDFIKTIFKR